MRDSAFGPVAVPPDFWARPDVRGALASRDIGGLFRLVCQWTGASQMRVGTATGFAQGRVSDIVNDKYHVATVPVFTRIADGLNMPADARILMGLAPSQDDAPAAAPAGPLGSAAASAASPLDGMQYPATTDHAIAVIAGLWNADAGHEESAISAPLNPGAWNAAALAWLVGQPDHGPP